MVRAQYVKLAVPMAAAAVLLFIGLQIMFQLGKLTIKVGMVVEEVASLQAVQGPHRLSSPSMIRNVNDWRATPLVTKLYYVNGKDNHPRYELMEKQLKNAGYNYERWPGQMITHINQVEPVWNQMLRNSTLPKEPWWNGWINRNYCWHDHEYWGARTPQMVGTVACCLNYIALLAHILEESQGHPDNAMYLLMEDDCLLHQHWEAKLAVVLEKVPEGWDAIRLGYWGKTRAMDAVNDAVYRVGTWWENGDSIYTGNHALLVSKKGIQNTLSWWAERSVCWTDAAIFGDELKVYALRDRLASELQVGRSRSAIDGNPEVHTEDGDNKFVAPSQGR